MILSSLGEKRIGRAEENWEGRREWEVLDIYWEFVTHALRVGPCEFRYLLANLVISSEQKSKQ